MLLMEDKMNKYLISINDLPPSGKEFKLDDQDIWLDPIKEFKMDCRIKEPLKARVFVMPADDGCVVKGEISGEVIVPCNRCSENALVKIDNQFDEYEDIPSSDKKSNENKDITGHVVFDRNAPMLNLAEVAWEQFMLAMPVRPLCRSDCKGLCPQCGANLNLGDCGCERQAGDPRLEALRNLKVNRQ